MLKKTLALGAMLALVTACDDIHFYGYDTEPTHLCPIVQNENVPDRVFFASGSATLTDQARGILDDQAQWMQDHPDSRIVITGHSDERGSRKVNHHLSWERANAVKAYLSTDGVYGARIIVNTSDQTLVPGHNEDAWAQNRAAITTVYTKRHKVEENEDQ